MYHYVRKNCSENPYSRHKDIDEFQNECEYLKKIASFYNIRDLSTLKKNDKKTIFLTFDDGIKDHIKVAKMLHNMKLKGTFYIPIQPYLNKKILPVHKAQMICSKVGGNSIYFMKKAFDRLEINMEKLIDKFEVDKFKNRYQNQNDDNKIKQFKKIINYIGKPKLVEKILDEMIKDLNIDDNYLSFYLSPEEIIFISKLGFEIGSHGVSHKPFSRLSYEKQDYELSFSKNYLEKMINKEIVSFCFPYGRKSSYNDVTLKLLKEKGYKYAVSIEEREINSVDIKTKNYELPRFDCNQISKLFPEIKNK